MDNFIDDEHIVRINIRFIKLLELLRDKGIITFEEYQEIMRVEE